MPLIIRVGLSRVNPNMYRGLREAVNDLFNIKKSWGPQTKRQTDKETGAQTVPRPRVLLKGDAMVFRRGHGNPFSCLAFLIFKNARPQN